MDSIIYELRANDIPEEDIQKVMQRVKNRISEKNIDEELVKLGYNKIFTVDYDDYDDYDDDYDDYENDNYNDYSNYDDDKDYY